MTYIDLEHARENLIYLVRRIVTTPYDQHLLLLDRLNDLDVALGEYDRARAAAGGFGDYGEQFAAKGGPVPKWIERRIIEEGG